MGETGCDGRLTLEYLAWIWKALYSSAMYNGNQLRVASAYDYTYKHRSNNK